MWLYRVTLKDVRSFKNETVEFSKTINIFVGPNNAGKSTILYGVGSMQEPPRLTTNDIRINSENGSVDIYFTDNKQKKNIHGQEAGRYVLNLGEGRLQLVGQDGTALNSNWQLVRAVEPNNFIYPYLSKRKVISYSEQINETAASRVTGNLQDLYAKVDKVSNPEVPAYSFFTRACDEVLGFRVTCSPSPNGKKACYIIDNYENISVDSMGEGVASLLGLMVDLAVAKDQLFLVEEPENDIHPKALKALLKLMIEKSEENQFIITTHSNIVARYLGAQPGAKIFEVNMAFEDKLPTSKVVEVQNDPEARRELLERLGYEFVDLDLWEGWLILEESSAERIIRDYLIPWFVPRLRGRLRTFSARTLNEIELKFEDFNRLFSFLNLEPVYKNKAWVVVDQGEEAKVVINKLRQLYLSRGWNEKQFLQFDEHDFEKYYPASFQERVKEVLEITDKREKWQRKRSLLQEIVSWIENNADQAKAAFENSAREVIGVLNQIETQM